MRKALVFALFLGAVFPVSATADSLAKFEGGIGVIPVSSAAGVQNLDGTFPNVNRNTVRGVNPAGQIWVIAGLSADVGLDGQITVDGRGLLLGGGNTIGGTNNQSVRATLLCANDGNVLHSSGLVPLAPNGDFRIDDLLTPAPPAVCDSPVLLIRNPAGSWFAAGIPKLD
ncbi:MAG: hypothetical protein HY729_14735 [Candidatus Rokubacteria bacterium]|nr:hypothetical protein [Candidatus Rokubacteria bacterium]